MDEMKLGSGKSGQRWVKVLPRNLRQEGQRPCSMLTEAIGDPANPDRLNHDSWVFNSDNILNA